MDIQERFEETSGNILLTLRSITQKPLQYFFKYSFNIFSIFLQYFLFDYMNIQERFEETSGNILLTLRSITQKPLQYFLDNKDFTKVRHPYPHDNKDNKDF